MAFSGKCAIFVIGQILLATVWTADVINAQRPAAVRPGSDSVIPVGSDPNAMTGTGDNSGNNDDSALSPNQMDTTSPWSQPLAPNQGATGGSEEQLQNIRDNMVGGVEAIRDSIVGLIAFIIGGAKNIVAKQVQGVMDTVHRVENKTILVKDNLQSAGGALVHTWADSLRQTGNITGQLVNAVGQNRQMQKK